MELLLAGEMPRRTWDRLLNCSCGCQCVLTCDR
jgi:hypothetical protein